MCYNENAYTTVRDVLKKMRNWDSVLQVGRGNNATLTFWVGQNQNCHDSTQHGRDIVL